MKTLYCLKKYYQELKQVISYYERMIKAEYSILDNLLREAEIDCLTIDKKHFLNHLGIINYKINHDSTINIYIETIQYYYDIKKAKENKLIQVEKRIKEIEQYLIEHKFL